MQQYSTRKIEKKKIFIIAFRREFVVFRVNLRATRKKIITLRDINTQLLNAVVYCIGFISDCNFDETYLYPVKYKIELRLLLNVN